MQTVPHPLIAGLTVALVDNPDAYLRDIGIKRKSRRLFNNDFVKMAKVEENLNNAVDRFCEFARDLYVDISDRRKTFHCEVVGGDFMNLWDILIEVDGYNSEFAFATMYVLPNDLYIGIENSDGSMKFEPYPQAYRKLERLENCREEVLAKRDRLMDEYGDDYCFVARFFVN